MTHALRAAYRTAISAAQACCYYAALLPRRGPHIASHSVCPSVCLSVRPSCYGCRASRGATKRITMTHM